jgi:hypothetical protein
MDKMEKRSWLGRRVWIASTEKPRQYGTICSVDYRALASVMIRLDGYRGVVLVEEMARGQKWDFEEANSEFDESRRCPPDLPARP